MQIAYADFRKLPPDKGKCQISLSRLHFCAGCDIIVFVVIE